MISNKYDIIFFSTSGGSTGCASTIGGSVGIFKLTYITLFVWRRRRDSKGCTLRTRYARYPIMFGFAERSSSLLLLKKINPTQPSGCIGFIWRRRRDSKGCALRTRYARYPIVFGFAERSSSLLLLR